MNKDTYKYRYQQVVAQRSKLLIDNFELKKALQECLAELNFKDVSDEAFFIIHPNLFKHVKTLNKVTGESNEQN